MKFRGQAGVWGGNCCHSASPKLTILWLQYFPENSCFFRLAEIAAVRQAGSADGSRVAS